MGFRQGAWCVCRLFLCRFPASLIDHFPSTAGHNPAHWRSVHHRRGYHHFIPLMHFVYSAIRIVIIDLVLSGDNAVVIGMAAHRLPATQRRMAILFGGIAATTMRVVLTAIAALLLQIPGLQVVGGALLIWIAFKLLNE